MSRWPDHLQDGRIYSLAHLAPFTHTFSRGGGETGQPLETYQVHVEFSTHCFTARGDAYGDQTLGVPYRSSGRLFSGQRYEHSAQLPDIVMNLDRARCLDSGHNQLVIEMTASDGEGRYEVYFSIKRTQERRLLLIVESAYFVTPDYVKKPRHAYRKKGLFTMLHLAANPNTPRPKKKKK